MEVHTYEWTNKQIKKYSKACSYEFSSKNENRFKWFNKIR